MAVVHRLYYSFYIRLKNVVSPSDNIKMRLVSFENKIFDYRKKYCSDVNYNLEKF